MELAQMGLGDWIAGDREAAIASFADDVEVFVPAELGNAGTYRGIEQFRSWFARVGRSLVGVRDDDRGRSSRWASVTSSR